VQGEAKKPQDQQDYEDCPKHIPHTFLDCGRLRREARLRRKQQDHKQRLV
jgi:hypothetical protein